MRLPRFSRAQLLLAVISFFVVMYAEWIYPAKAFDSCVWPLGPNAKHVVLIADPQIVDDHTYPGRNRIFQKVTEVVADRYMARNFRLLHKKMRPDAVFFLGDLLDGGREWENGPWVKEVERFKTVFAPSTRVSHYKNLPGNHDVGSADGIIPAAAERFKKVFGDPNQVQNIGDHNIVTLDTNALMNKNNEKISRPTKEFLESLKENQEMYDPIIVLTHVPLFRPPGSYCGFEREGRPLDWTYGHQYITEVTPEITDDIMFGLKPVYAFSGDDHDACKYTHQWGKERTEEYTVKTFSMCMGVSRPGFQVLSLDTRRRHSTDTCLLARPFVPFYIQIIAFGLLIPLNVLLSLRPRSPAVASLLPVSDSEKKEAATRRMARRTSREVLVGLIPIATAWSFGQILISLWSYSSNL